MFSKCCLFCGLFLEQKTLQVIFNSRRHWHVSFMDGLLWSRKARKTLCCEHCQAPFLLCLSQQSKPRQSDDPLPGRWRPTPLQEPEEPSTSRKTAMRLLLATKTWDSSDKWASWDGERHSDLPQRHWNKVLHGRYQEKVSKCYWLWKLLIAMTKKE